MCMDGHLCNSGSDTRLGGHGGGSSWFGFWKIWDASRIMGKRGGRGIFQGAKRDLNLGQSEVSMYLACATHLR